MATVKLIRTIKRTTEISISFCVSAFFFGPVCVFHESCFLINLKDEMKKLPSWQPPGKRATRAHSLWLKATVFCLHRCKAVQQDLPVCWSRVSVNHLYIWPPSETLTTCIHSIRFCRAFGPPVNTLAPKSLFTFLSHLPKRKGSTQILDCLCLHLQPAKAGEN